MIRLIVQYLVTRKVKNFPYGFDKEISSPFPSKCTIVVYSERNIPSKTYGKSYNYRNLLGVIYDVIIFGKYYTHSGKLHNSYQYYSLK